VLHPEFQLLSNRLHTEVLEKDFGGDAL
jgi:hypothetical protein